MSRLELIDVEDDQIKLESAAIAAQWSVSGRELVDQPELKLLTKRDCIHNRTNVFQLRSKSNASDLQDLVDLPPPLTHTQDS